MTLSQSVIGGASTKLAVDDPDALMAHIRNAGAIFVGRHTPEVIGDYVGGSNHVLPTARSARFSSGLSVLDFVKRITVQELSPAGLRSLGPVAVSLARLEGLDAHAGAVTRRLAALAAPDEAAAPPAASGA